MRSALATDPSSETQVTPSSRSALPRRRTVAIIVSVLFALFCCYAVVIAAHWPFTKQAVLEALQDRSARPVSIGTFRPTYFPPGCLAGDLRFYRDSSHAGPPLIAISRLDMHTNYLSVLLLQRHLSNVRLEGMHLYVPAKENSDHGGAAMPLNHSRTSRSVTIGTIEVNGAILDFLSEVHGQQPFRVIVEKLVLHNAGDGRAMSYVTRLHNSLPPGEISSTGTFGPWDPNDPGSTQLQGGFSYRHADLSVFDQLSGLLAADGKFAGSLREIRSSGTADVQGFRIKNAAHARPLATQFDAAINGLNGDVTLNRVTAQFDRTAAEFTGSVAGSPGVEGKTVNLNVSSGQARVEDLFRLVIKSPQPPLTGKMNLSGRITVPPGPEPFLRRVTLEAGRFKIIRAEFTNAPTEQDLTRLSQSARKADKESVSGSKTPFEVQGLLTAKTGTAHFGQLYFVMPGAQSSSSGIYDLLTHTLNLHGTLITDGDVSKATTGFRSAFVKVISPFFKRRAKAKIVHFKVTGSYGHTQVGLDLDPDDPHPQ